MTAAQSPSSGSPWPIVETADAEKGNPKHGLQSSQQGRALGWDYRLEQSPEVMIP